MRSFPSDQWVSNDLPRPPDQATLSDFEVFFDAVDLNGRVNSSDLSDDTGRTFEIVIGQQSRTCCHEPRESSAV